MARHRGGTHSACREVLGTSPLVVDRLRFTWISAAKPNPHLAHHLRHFPLARAPACELTAATPELTYRGGPLLGAVEVFTVFWGTTWTESADLDLTVRLNDFFDFALTSPLMDQLAEYSVPGFTIGHGTRVGTTTVDSPVPATLTDEAIQETLQTWIADDPAFPQGHERLVDGAMIAPVVDHDQLPTGDLAGQPDGEAVGVGRGQGELPVGQAEPARELLAHPDHVFRRQHEGEAPARLPADGLDWYEINIAGDPLASGWVVGYALRL